MTGPYAAVAASMFVRGWAGVLPLPPRAKKWPPDGFTGRSGADPDLDQVLAWVQARPDWNIGVRVPRGVLGIDVDHYGDKNGGDTLRALEEECGPLPATWWSTSRDDGVSGIRMFRVPVDYVAAGEAGPGIEIVQYHHRYVVVAPSIHPEGRRYRWLSPDGKERDAAPTPDELPDLPGAWLERLRGGPAAVMKADLTTEETSAALDRWLTGGDPDDRVRRVLEPAVVELFSAGSRHESATRSTLRLVRLGAEGRPGVRSAVETLQRAFAAATENRDPGEWRRLVDGAAALVAAGATDDPQGPAAAGSVFIDWADFWAEDDTAAEWLLDDVLARGRGHLIYAKHKAGKSLLMLWCVVELVRRGEVVVYLDYEQSKNDLRERLTDMGCGPETDLSRLRYALLPTLPPLNTAAGGDALLALVDDAAKQHPGREVVVVIDTISRAVDGEENSADTAQGFYTHTGLGLKRRAATWVRLDHAGKDESRGARGNSAKGDDVDVIWRLVETDGGVDLVRDAARMTWVPERVPLRKEAEPVLRYVPTRANWPAGTLEIADALTRLGVPVDASYRDAVSVLKDHGKGRRQRVVLAALKYRREAGHTPGHTRQHDPGHTAGHNVAEPLGQAPDTPRDTPGHARTGDRDTPRVPVRDTVWPTPTDGDLGRWARLATDGEA